MNSFQYYVLDVFADHRFEGNPLAVVLTEEDLSLSLYQSIAREFGYSETSFIYYSQAHHALKVRSFTPTGHEVGGAGHNLLGAVCLALLAGIDIFRDQEDEQFVVIKGDRIDLKVDFTNPCAPFVGMLQAPAVIHGFVEREDVAKALNLDASQVLSDKLTPAIVSTEATHLMVPIRDTEALNAIQVNKNSLIEIAARNGFEGFYCFVVQDKGAPFLVETRFFNPGIGIDEDPATGSAAGPLAGFLHQKDLIQLDTTYQFLQGSKMQRPSVIRFEVAHEGIWISGSASIVMEGTIYDS